MKRVTDRPITRRQSSASSRPDSISDSPSPGIENPTIRDDDKRLRTENAAWCVHLIWPAGRALSLKAERVKAWILEAAGVSAGAAVPESDSTVISIARSGHQ